MKFQRARSKEQISNRQTNIMNSAKQIMEKQSFNEVTFSNIAKLTKLSRPSIYIYYKFPEEILANILIIELSNFNINLNQSNPSNQDELTKVIVKNTLNNKFMMKLLSLNFSIIEDNIRDKMFLKLKKQIFSFMNIIKDKILTINPKANKNEIYNTKYSILTLLSAIYPITHDDGKHLNLIRKVDSKFNKPNHEKLLTYNINIILYKVLK